MKCKKCGNELENKSVACPNCGNKAKTPIFKKWWFWVIIVIFVLIVSVASGGTENTDTSTNNETSSQVGSQIITEAKTEKTIEYEKVEIQQMIDDLKANALKAEKTYNNKYVEITGVITNFDSNGSYINIEAVTAGDFNFDTISCSIKNDEQLNFLMEKSVGDTITVKGKITSVGEVLGYFLNIDEVQ